MAISLDHSQRSFGISQAYSFCNYVSWEVAGLSVVISTCNDIWIHSNNYFCCFHRVQSAYITANWDWEAHSIEVTVVGWVETSARTFCLLVHSKCIGIEMRGHNLTIEFLPLQMTMDLHHFPQKLEISRAYRHWPSVSCDVTCLTVVMSTWNDILI